MGPQTSVHSAIRAALLIGAIMSATACGSRSKSSDTTASPATTSAASPTTVVTSTTTGVSSVASTSTAAAVTTTVDDTATIAEITKNWETFFQAGTPLADREALLEDGTQYEAALTQRASDPLQAQASATVSDVTLTDATHAHVVYDVSLAGTVALPAAEGNAVLQDGTWKVSAESFCSLIALGASEPIPGCS